MFCYLNKRDIFTSYVRADPRSAADFFGLNSSWLPPQKPKRATPLRISFSNTVIPHCISYIFWLHVIWHPFEYVETNNFFEVGTFFRCILSAFLSYHIYPLISHEGISTNRAVNYFNIQMFHLYLESIWTSQCNIIQLEE